jgi:polyphosphate kinase 2
MNQRAALMRRIHAELIDGYDEELELEIEDQFVDDLSDPTEEEQAQLREDRRTYFKELFHLQGELVKLQDWVVATGHKAVIVFEGRDAAGKGGVIKRIMQRLNPRVCRVVALPAPNDRERTQWYFQRYVPHLPAAGEIVLFDRSWYNRAGVEKVMGFCDDEQYEEFFARCPSLKKCWCAHGIQFVKYWFSISDEEQHARFLAASMTRSNNGSSAPWTWKAAAAGKMYTRAKEVMLERTHIRRVTLVGGAGGGQEKGQPELHCPSAGANALRRNTPPAHCAARARAP